MGGCQNEDPSANVFQLCSYLTQTQIWVLHVLRGQEPASAGQDAPAQGMNQEQIDGEGKVCHVWARAKEDQ